MRTTPIIGSCAPLNYHYIGASIQMSDLAVGLNIVSDVDDVNNPGNPAPLPVYASADEDYSPVLSAVSPGSVLGFTTDSSGSEWVKILITPDLVKGSTNTIGYILLADVQQAMSSAELAAQQKILAQTNAANKQVNQQNSMWNNLFGNLPDWVPWAIGGAIAIPLFVAIIDND